MTERNEKENIKRMGRKKNESDIKKKKKNEFLKETMRKKEK